MFSAEDMIHMDRVEAKCSPSFSLENPLIKAKDQFSKNLVVPSWHTPFVLLPGGKIFSHSMAIKPRIIIIVAQLHPTTRTIITLEGHERNYSDRFVLPVFVTTELCNNAGSTFEAGWEIYK